MSEVPKYKTPKEAKMYVYISHILFGKEITESEIVIAASKVGLMRSSELIEMVDVQLPPWPIEERGKRENL